MIAFRIFVQITTKNTLLISFYGFSPNLEHLYINWSILVGFIFSFDYDELKQIIIKVILIILSCTGKCFTKSAALLTKKQLAVTCARYEVAHKAFLSNNARV